MLVGALTLYSLLYSMCNLKAAQMNVQRSLILEIMFYGFELSYGSDPKYLKGEGAVDHRTVTRWFKKFRSRCKNLDNQTGSGRPKTVDSEAVLRAIEANLVSSTRRVSGELDSVIGYFYDFNRSTQNR